MDTLEILDQVIDVAADVFTEKNMTHAQAASYAARVADFWQRKADAASESDHDYAVAHVKAWRYVADTLTHPQ